MLHTDARKAGLIVGNCKIKVHTYISQAVPRSPHIVEFLEFSAVAGRDQFLAAHEFCDQGDFLSFRLAHSLSEAQAKVFTKQLILGKK